MLSSKFICATERVCDRTSHVPAPLFRKSFTLYKKPHAASLTLCGLGLYELFINGKRITKGALAPYINNPDHILYYDAYDLLPYLREGENVFGVMLGNGFFNPLGGAHWGFDKAPWRGPLRLAFSLEIEDGDGRTVQEADGSVRVSDSAVLFDDLRIGAFYDAAREQAGWCDAGFDDSGWGYAKPIAAPKGEARLCEAEPVRVYRELRPISLSHTDELCYVCEASASYDRPIACTRVQDVYVYDFGENNAGVCRLRIRGRAGQKVTLRFGEDVFDGKFSLRSTVNMNRYEELDLLYPQMDTYILRGKGVEEFVPPFTYHGFRYVLVEGITKEQATPDLLTYLVMSSDTKPRATFSCSDERLNKLYEMTCRADRANLMYVPTDCPHREKNGWTADISLSAEHILLNFDATLTLGEWLRSVKCAQRESGELPGVVPTAGFGFRWGNGPIWDSVCVYLPYYCYQYSGDRGIIKENLDMIFRYLRYALSRRDERGLLEYGLEDWAQPNEEVENTLAPVLFTDSAMVFDMAKKAAFLATEAGEPALAEEAEEMAAQMKQAIRRHLIDPATMTAAGDCQTSQAVAIAFGLFEPEELPAALDRLLETIRRADGHLLCGVLGGRFLFHVLATHGYADMAMKVLTAPTYPSYMQWVENGCTALCESFVPSGKGEKHGRDSKNHHFWGDISSFLIRQIAGIKPNPSCRNVREFEISPAFPKKIGHAAASVALAGEEVSVSWKRGKDGILLHVTASAGAVGRILLPQDYRFEDGSPSRAIASGTYLIRS